VVALPLDRLNLVDRKGKRRKPFRCNVKLTTPYHPIDWGDTLSSVHQSQQVAPTLVSPNWTLRIHAS
jgi:hypothetical protein